MPGGNADGFDAEGQIETGLRELREELGLGYEDEDEAKRTGLVHGFCLHPFSTTLKYNRALVIARDPRTVEGKLNEEHETVTLIPTPLDEYMEWLLNPGEIEPYPEVRLGFLKAVRDCGQAAVRSWLVDGQSADVSHVPYIFGKAMTLIE